MFWVILGACAVGYSVPGFFFSVRLRDFRLFVSAALAVFLAVLCFTYGFAGNAGVDALILRPLILFFQPLS